MLEGYTADGPLWEDVRVSVCAAAEKPVGFGSLALRRCFCQSCWCGRACCCLKPLLSLPLVPLLHPWGWRKKLSGDAVASLPCCPRAAGSLREGCLSSSCPFRIWEWRLLWAFQQGSAGSFALTQLKVAAVLSLENALGSSRDVVAPRLALWRFREGSVLLFFNGFIF